VCVSACVCVCVCVCGVCVCIFVLLFTSSHLFHQDEKNGKIVLYTTTVKAVREMHSQCEEVRKVLYNMRLKVVVKDISMDSDLIKELEERLPGSTVPQLFANGVYFGVTS
jgi:glutaredoxin-related protein